MNQQGKWICLAVLVLNLAGCGNNEVISVEPVVRPVKEYRVLLNNIMTYPFPGEVAASEQASMAFRVSGQLLKYHVVSGQHVTAGQLLAELDDTTYQLLADAASAAHELALVEFNRAQTLVKDALISKQDFDQSKADLEIAKAHLLNAQSQVDYCRLYAPFDGIVANTYFENFEHVQAQQQVASIHSDDYVDVKIQIPEPIFKSLGDSKQRASNATDWLDIQVVFPAQSNNRYAAKIKEMSTVADPDTASFAFTLTLPRPESANLYPGMSANVFATLQHGRVEQSPRIPVNAIFFDGQQRYVWKIDPVSHEISAVPVRLNNNHELISGLEHGDVIVATGVNDLKSGQKVTAWVKERGL